MNIRGIQLNKREVIVILILLSGLIAAVVLVQTKQIFRSRATDTIISQFSTKGQGGEEVKSDNNGNFTTPTLKVTVDFKDPGPVAGDGSPIKQ